MDAAGAAKRCGACGPKKILIETGRLRDSMTYWIPRLRVLEVGTNVVYAAARQFGVSQDVTVPAHRRQVRAHTRRMRLPARPFVVIQREDIRAIELILAKFIMEERHS